MPKDLRDFRRELMQDPQVRWHYRCLAPVYAWARVRVAIRACLAEMLDRSDP